MTIYPRALDAIFPVTMQPLSVPNAPDIPNPVYTNQLAWLPWPDNEDIVTRLGGEPPTYYTIMPSKQTSVSGAGNRYSILYLTLMQWSIKIDQNGGGAPPASPGQSPAPGGNMCTPDKGTQNTCTGPPILGTNCDAKFACEKCTPDKNPYWVQYSGHCGTLGSEDKCQYAEKCFIDQESCLNYANSGRKYFKTGDSVPSCS